MRLNGMGKFGVASALVLCAAAWPGLTEAAPITTGLSVWFDAADGSTLHTTGSALDQWDNKAVGQTGSDTRGLVSATASGTARPVVSTGTGGNGLNGLSVVKFDGVNDIMKTQAFSSPIAQQDTTFVVWYAANVNTSGIVVDGLSGAGATRQAFDYTRDSNTGAAFIELYAGAQSGAFRYTTATGQAGQILGQPLEMTIRWNNTNTAWTISPNGSLLASLSPANTGNFSLDGMTLGAGFSNDGFWLNGYIAEVLVYDRPLDPTTEIPLIESYLDSKWFGIPEPASLSVLAVGAVALVARPAAGVKAAGMTVRWLNRDD